VNSTSEPTQIGLSEKAHAKLRRLKDDNHFLEMVDAYRCAIALALAHGAIPGEIPLPRTTVFSVATVDPDRDLAAAIKAVMSSLDIPVYRMAERLAEWGVEELARLSENGEIDFGSVLAEAESLKATE
jgi:hypothetical protein